MIFEKIPGFSDLQNIRALKHAQHFLAKQSDKKQRSIIFLVTRIPERGGAESRMLAYADGLKARGIRPIFVSEENHHSDILSRHICLTLNFHAFNYTRCLKEIVKMWNVETVELQIRSRRYIYTLDVDSLSKVCRTGCMIHGNICQLYYEAINRFNYRIIVSDRMRAIEYGRLRDYFVLPNGIEVPENGVWKYKGQRKALILSRIDESKLANIAAVILFLRNSGIHFELVGAAVDGKVEKLADMVGGFREGELHAGAVDGMKYMAENADKYLCVAGVGLVLLEAGALGYPCLIAADLGEKYCTFVTREALQSAIFGRNLTYQTNDALKEANIVRELSLHNLDKFDLRPVLMAQYSMASRLDAYLPIALP